MIPTSKRFARCPACGGTNDAGSPACYLCGTAPLVAECPSCGADIANPVRTTCARCGRRYLPDADEGAGQHGPESPFMEGIAHGVPP